MRKTVYVINGVCFDGLFNLIFGTYSPSLTFIYHTSERVGDRKIKKIDKPPFLLGLIWFIYELIRWMMDVFDTRSLKIGVDLGHSDEEDK